MTKHTKITLEPSTPSFRWIALLCLFFSFIFQGISQTTTPIVSSTVDTTAIKIGEQINFKVTVEADSTAQVTFPEGQTFLPLEMVEAMLTDTIKKQDRVTLQKIYALTQFDSGGYTLPQQKITIDDKVYLTDSIRIAVTTIAVDTVSKEFYDIKPLIKVDKSSSNIWNILIGILLGIGIVGGLLYWFVWRKKPLTEEEKVALLPPYDRAMLELKNLENSKYLIQDEYKEYYSELTTIVRSYLEEDAKVSALESTTDQLIEKLEVLKDAGELTLNDDTIDQFKRILQTADLVKFAKSKPQTSVAEHDRKTIEQIVTETKEALPEPTLEDLLKNEAYLEELAQKKRRKKILITAAVIFGIGIVSGAVSIAYYGFTNVKDTVLGHPTKTLLEREWVSSSYGYPAMIIESPHVLKRVDGEFISNFANLDTVQNDEKRKAASEVFENFTKSAELGISEFILEEGGDDFYLKYEDFTLPTEKEADIEKEAEESIEIFAKQDRVKNMVTKREKFSTPSGQEGLKQYGTLNFKSSEDIYEDKNYIILNFTAVGTYKRLFLIWNVDDEYADKIVERILDSIELKTEL